MKKMFSTKNEGPFKPNKEEVDKLEFFSVNETLKMIENGLLTPPSSEVMKRVIKNPELLRKLGLE